MRYVQEMCYFSRTVWPVGAANAPKGRFRNRSAPKSPRLLQTPLNLLALQTFLKDPGFLQSRKTSILRGISQKNLFSSKMSLFCFFFHKDAEREGHVIPTAIGLRSEGSSLTFLPAPWNHAWNSRLTSTRGHHGRGKGSPAQGPDGGTASLRDRGSKLKPLLSCQPFLNWEGKIYCWPGLTAFYSHCKWIWDSRVGEGTDHRGTVESSFEDPSNIMGTIKWQSLPGMSLRIQLEPSGASALKHMGKVLRVSRYKCFQYSHSGKFLSIKQDLLAV